MQKNMEIELKLVLSKKALKTFLEAPLCQGVLRQGSKKERRLVSTYYDTEELKLKAKGIAYRVRDKGDGSFEATVKTAQRSSSGLSQRLELNLPLTEDKPVLEGFGALGLGYELTELAPEGVEPLFTVEVDRTTYILDLAGAVVELAVDQGKITTPRRRKAKDVIEEVELELLEGDVAPLLSFVAELTELVPVFVEKRSKFARGLALLDIPTDEQCSKVKVDMQGNVRQQILALVQMRGDLLLQLQNSLVRQVELADVKELQKQLRYLGSYLALGMELAPTPQVAQAQALLLEIGTLAEKLHVLAELDALWQKLCQEGGAILENNVLDKRIQEERAEAEQALQQFAQEGRLSRLVYQALGWLQVQTWQNEEYLEMAALARCRLKAWQEEAEQAEPEQALGLVQYIYALSRTLPGKAYTRIADEAKKERRRLQEQVDRTALLSLVQGYAHGSNSRILPRDAGVVMGWLWARQ